jgi:uncharacterized membrane protein YfcA
VAGPLPDLVGWIALGLGALIASTVGGVAGFGAGIIMIPLVAFVMGTKATVPVMTVAMLLGNGGRVWFSRRDIEGRVVVAFLVTGIPTSVMGALLYTQIDSAWIGRVLGAFMLVSVPLRRLLLGQGVRVRLAHFPIVGAVFGFLSSLVGSVGPILTPFFLGHGLRKGAYIGTDALCTLGTYVSRGIVFRKHDLLAGHTVLVGLFIGLVMIAGAWAGRRLVDKMSERVFLGLIEALLLLFGLQFLLWPTR